MGRCEARIGARTACSTTWTSRSGSRRITRGGRSGRSVDHALGELSSELKALYSHPGSSVDPARALLRALLLQASYSVRLERLLMKQLDYNLLYRWFAGLGIDDSVWHPTAFTTNRGWLLARDVAAKFVVAVLSHPRAPQLLSREHLRSTAAWSRPGRA